MVTFATPPATVKIYDPTTGVAATETHAAVSNVTLTLTDHPDIVEVVP